MGALPYPPYSVAIMFLFPSKERDQIVLFEYDNVIIWRA